MGVPIRSGTVLIREGIRLPENLDLESIAWMPGWRILKTLVGFSVGQAAQHAGWAFQFVGDSLQGNAIGGGEKTLHRALRGILAGLRASRFNALEVTAVTTNRFLGDRKSVV